MAAGLHKLLRQRVVYISLTISMSLKHLHKDPIGCQLMKHTSQELMSYASGSAWQVYIGLTLPWIACTESHSATLQTSLTSDCSNFQQQLQFNLVLH
jgi:hypothetical protein